MAFAHDLAKALDGTLFADLVSWLGVHCIVCKYFGDYGDIVVRLGEGLVVELSQPPYEIGALLPLTQILLSLVAPPRRLIRQSTASQVTGAH